MNFASKGFDFSIVVCILVLCGFGVAIIGSVASSLAASQVFYYLIGFVLFYIFSKIDYRVFGSIWKQIYAVSLGLLLVTLILGLESRGAMRWISILGFRLQFSEVLKPFLLSSLAVFLTEGRTNFKKYLTAALLGVVPMLLIFKQPDLGSALVYLAGFGTMIFLSGINIFYLVAAGVGGIIFLPLFWHFLADYQKNRIISFVNPASDPLGASYNAIQATIAVGSGQLFGLGLGRGTQSQLLFLPEHHTDFVFASLAEELGFIGAGVLLLVYFVLIWRIFKISQAAPDKLGRVLSSGLAMMLLGQIFINIGMNMGIMPVTGITLPLVSYGGSSVLATFIALGIVENIAQERSF
ncbi:rod shape-determining protein RodA [Patescibacteria group bacterium]|nr:rod shape-determining protein RodA [Patescibacteria group bacterium]